MSNRPNRLEIRAEPDLKPRLRYIVANSEHDDGSMSDVMHRLVYDEFDRILIRQGHLTSSPAESATAAEISGDEEEILSELSAAMGITRRSAD